MAGALASSRVVKKMSPGQPGALKLARRYGDALVCVRYRLDAQGRHRYTTVELVVDSAPLQVRSERIVMVRLDFNEKQLHSVVPDAIH